MPNHPVDMSSWGGISLLSPEYLLSFERCSFHTLAPDHYAPSFLPARHVCLPVKRPYAITLYEVGYQSTRGHLLEASVTLLEATTPVKLPTKRGPPIKGVRNQTAEGPYFNSDSTNNWRARFKVSGLSYTSTARLQR